MADSMCYTNSCELVVTTEMLSYLNRHTCPADLPCIGSDVRTAVMKKYFKSPSDYLETIWEFNNAIMLIVSQYTNVI